MDTGDLGIIDSFIPLYIVMDINEYKIKLMNIFFLSLILDYDIRYSL